MRYADLHLHTIFSDGTYTPVELVAAGRKCGLSAIAIADHDTVEGIRPCIEIAGREGPEVIPAIELSAECLGREIHLLGYFVDYKNKELLKKLQELKQNRTARIYKIVEKLKACGINLDPQEVLNIAGCGTAGRLHVARAMVKNKLTDSIFGAFQKYIGDNGPAFILGFRFSPLDAISLIRQSGGIPVLAHPYTLKNDELIQKFVEYGLMGLEAYYPEHSQGMTNFYLDLAKKYKLLVTGGSDCHGKAKPEVKIGSMKIPYALVEKLKEAKANLG